MDYCPPSSSVPGILQARILEWVAMPSYRGSSQPRDRNCNSYVSCIGRWVLFFYHWHHLGSPNFKLFPHHYLFIIKERTFQRRNLVHWVITETPTAEGQADPTCTVEDGTGAALPPRRHSWIQARGDLRQRNSGDGPPACTFLKVKVKEHKERAQEGEKSHKKHDCD